MKSSKLQKLKAKNVKWITTDPSGIPFLEIQTYHSLIQSVGYLKYIHNKEGDVLFRGQNKLYPNLHPSLYRGIKGSSGMQNRNKVLSAYIKQCRQNGDSLVAVPEYAHEPLLQHYGIKTRWIDLVDNLWVALWFGCFDFITNGGRSDQAHFQVRRLEDYLFILCVLTGNSKEEAEKPGYFVSDSLITIDLRKASPSQYLRPHAQHALLARMKKLQTLTDIDMMDNVVGIIRVSVRDGLTWLGQGDLISDRNLFPPPHYDYGYGILMDTAPIGSNLLGSITHFFP